MWPLSPSARLLAAADEFASAHVPTLVVTDPAQEQVFRDGHALSPVLLQELFVRYYPTMMPMLKTILTSSMERKSHRRLCGKALECISLVAMSVGKETFYGDAQEFMHVLSTLTSTDLEPDDPILTYVQTAGTRMCRCLGHEFVPLLPTFVPPLLRSAGKKSELTVRTSHLHKPCSLRNSSCPKMGTSQGCVLHVCV